MARNHASIRFSDEEIAALRTHIAGLAAMLSPKSVRWTPMPADAVFRMGERFPARRA